MLSAAQAALEDGYRLRIYEAFRSNEATRYLYDTVAAKLRDPALVYDGEENAVDPVIGWQVDLATGFLVDPETGEQADPAELPEEEPGDGGEEDGPAQPREETGEDAPEAEEPPAEDGEEPPDYPTYGAVMTDAASGWAAFWRR